jgi:hypothetical protein
MPVLHTSIISDCYKFHELSQYSTFLILMSGERDLQQLLLTMRPHLREDTYVFCTVPSSRYGDLAEAHPIASFSEAEGLSLILPLDQAERFQLTYAGLFRCITLQVHSSLQAVGFTAAIARQLSLHGISANVVAAYHHDHVFIPAVLADQAVQVLLQLSQQPTPDDMDSLES